MNLLGGDKLALVRVEGVIYDARDWIDQIRDYQEDRSIRGIVLRVDSPGGAVSPSQDLHRAVLEAQRDYGKVVVASFGSVAASGGYYIACGADRIVTSPGTLTGSIGVYAKFLEAKELFEKIGIDYETVKAGKYKTAGSMEREMTEEEKEMMQSVIDDTYMQFVEAVADGRRESMSRLLKQWESTDSDATTYPFTDDVIELIQEFQEELQKVAQKTMKKESQPIVANKVESGTDPSRYAQIENATDSMIANATAAEVEEATATEVKEATATQNLAPSREIILKLVTSLAEGKIYTGRQAKEIALVDEIGTLDDAIELTAELVGIRGRPQVIKRKEREYSWLDLISEKLSSFTGRETHSPIQYRFPY